MRPRSVSLAWIFALCVFCWGSGFSFAAEQKPPRPKKLNSQQQLRARLGVYVVVWEVTTDMKGKVEQARIAKIIPPLGEQEPTAPIEIPAVYQDNARKKIAQRKYRVMTEVVETPEPPAVKGRKKRSRHKAAPKPTRPVPMKVFTSSYYDPRRPEEVIVRLPRK
ncbi:MAG: hypothetical protein HOP18_11905 [Deltaproteobacteria bacterium]|nr:hypothetical protein [Deltaproteobacteria bacterium]